MTKSVCIGCKKNNFRCVVLKYARKRSYECFKNNVCTYVHNGYSYSGVINPRNCNQFLSSSKYLDFNLDVCRITKVVHIKHLNEKLVYLQSDI